MRSSNWLGAATVVSVFAVLSTGCALAGEEEENEAVGEAPQGQLDPGFKDWMVYSILDVAGSLKAKVLVTATSGGGFTANREYWYMTSNLSSSATYDFVGSAPDFWSNPPSGLGTLSFTTLRTPTWSSATPRNSMQIWTDPTGAADVGMEWSMSVSGGVWSGSIYWWHENTNDIFGPSATYTMSFGAPSGSTWYKYQTSPL